MRRNWIKIYVDQCLRGTMMDEMDDPAERFVWFGFLLLAGDSPFEGKIALTESIGYTDEQLGSLLKCDPTIIQSAKILMVKHNKIRILENNIIEIVNWKRYQSEYQRQKPYRSGNGQKLLRKVTTQGDSQIEKEKEIEKEIRKDNKIYAEIITKKGIKYFESLSEIELKILNLLMSVDKFPIQRLKTIEFMIKLMQEFPKVDALEAVKEKIAWWLKKPLKKDSNPYLQLRNWFRIASGKSSYQQGDARVGAKGKEIKRTTPDDFPDHDVVFVHQVHEIARKEYSHLWGGEPTRFAGAALKYWETIKENFKELGETAEAFVKLIAIEADKNKEEK